jgi:hypothetical protein
VPAAALLSSGGGFGYAHTDYDTLDKVAPESFTIPLLAAGACIIECATAPSAEFRG